MRCKIALIAAAAVTLCAAPVARATDVLDPDDAGVLQDVDIEWASSNWLAVPHDPLISISVKTFSAYRQRPCIRVVVTTRTYAACTTNLHRVGLQSGTPITVTETPAGHPNTVTYRFFASQVRASHTYRWRAELGNYDTTVDARDHLPGPPTIDEIDPFPPLDPPDLP